MRRAIHVYIDGFFIALITILCLFGVSRVNEYAAFDRFTLYAICWFLYYFVMEYFFGFTIGKLLSNTRVTFESDDKPKFLLVAIRTISRLIPFEPFSIFFDDNQRMWHDKLSKSTVVKKRKETTTPNKS